MPNPNEFMTTGVINPYVLTELKLRKRINWKQVREPRKLLERTMNMPYDKLFDPMHGGPLYDKSHLTDVAETERIVLPLDIVIDEPWHDPGQFYSEAAELTDPVQGAALDCYLIAALSSIAWARPYFIAQKTRATGTEQPKFVDMVEIYNVHFPPDDDGKVAKIEVNEFIPWAPAGDFIYAKSSELGEIWPAVYEKAYAKWCVYKKTKKRTDHPNYDYIAFGDPTGALAQLTGLASTVYSTVSLTADQIFTTVADNCLKRKTFNPMVASTYDSEKDAPDSIKYSDANLVGKHSYSILGLQQTGGHKYIVLRNPWGTHEATLSIDGGTWTAWDEPYKGGPGWWRPIDLATDDGIFALEADTFKKYFSGFGVVKEA